MSGPRSNHERIGCGGPEYWAERINKPNEEGLEGGGALKARFSARAPVHPAPRPGGRDWSILGCALGVFAFVSGQLGLHLPVDVLVGLGAVALIMVLHGMGATRLAIRTLVRALGHMQLARDVASAARLCEQAAEALSDLIHSSAAPPSSVPWLNAIGHRGDRRLLQTYESDHKGQVLSALGAASRVGTNVPGGIERIARSPRGQSDLCQIESELRLLVRCLDG